MPPKQKQKQKQKQSVKQSVVVKVGASESKTAPRKRAVRRPRSVPQPMRQPLGASINLSMSQPSHAIPSPQPSMNEYNALLRTTQQLLQNQMKTGSLIPNAQVTAPLRNPLVSSNPNVIDISGIKALSPEELQNYMNNKYNPLTMPSTNNQRNMRDPYEGVREHVVEYETTADAYDPDPLGQVSVGTEFTLGDVDAGIVAEDPSEMFYLEQMSRALTNKGSLGERSSMSIAPTLVPRWDSRSVVSEMTQLDKYDDEDLEVSLGKEVSERKRRAMASTSKAIGTSIPAFTPTPEKKRGRPPKQQSLGEFVRSPYDIFEL